MAMLLVLWIGVSLLFCLALFRAAARPQPSLEDLSRASLKAPEPIHREQEPVRTSKAEPSLRAA